MRSEWREVALDKEPYLSTEGYFCVVKRHFDGVWYVQRTQDLGDDLIRVDWTRELSDAYVYTTYSAARLISHLNEGIANLCLVVYLVKDDEKPNR